MKQMPFVTTIHASSSCCMQLIATFMRRQLPILNVYTALKHAHSRHTGTIVADYDLAILALLCFACTPGVPINLYPSLCVFYFWSIQAHSPCGCLYLVEHMCHLQ